MDRFEEPGVDHGTKNGGITVQLVSDAYLKIPDHNGHRNVSHAYTGNATNKTEQTRVRVRAFRIKIWMARC